MAQATRQTAGERRIAVLEAANVEFALRGLHGASTDAIARRAGISQPYLFRLFGSKKELFIAVIEDCFARTLESFREAASGKSGADALQAIGETYAVSIEEDRTMLQGQLQSYAASVEDDDIREARHADTAGSSTTSRPSRAPIATRSHGSSPRACS